MSIPLLTAQQMEALCQELQPILIHSTLVRCIAVDPLRLFLIFENGPIRKILFLGFRKPFLRFHLISSTPIPKGKDIDCFLTSFLKDAQLRSIKMLNQDRILQLAFAFHGQQRFLIGEFFSKHPNYYVLNDEGKILFSLYKLNQSHYQVPPAPSFSSSSPSSFLSQEEMEKMYKHLEDGIDFEEEKSALLQQLKYQLKQIQRRQTKLQQELEICHSWEEMQLEGELLKANYTSLKKGLTSISVWDWNQDQGRTLSLDPTLTPQEQITQRFRRSKKLQKGLPYVQEQLEKGQKQIQASTLLIEKLNEIQSKNELDAFHQKFIPQKKSQSIKVVSKSLNQPYQEYESETGIKIWVGKNAKDNEKLTFSLAKGSDWWLHTQDFPGSHVIIRTPKGKEPDPETLLDAMQLALYSSKAKSRGEAEICVTQRKFVSRLSRGTPGKVQVSKHKNIFVRLDPERYQNLKQRRNKENLNS